MRLQVKLGIAAVAARGCWRLFVQDEAGQDLIEYALVAALIGLGAIASMQSVSGKLSASFTRIAASISAS